MKLTKEGIYWSDHSQRGYIDGLYFNYGNTTFTVASMGKSPWQLVSHGQFPLESFIRLWRLGGEAENLAW